MITLLIDTSVENSILIFLKDNNLLYHSDIFPSFNSSKFVFSEIIKGLEKNNLSLNKLDYICVSIGPGSYTGTRVGVSIAKSLGYALKIPVIPFCSLHAYIPSINEGDFVSMIDARSGGAYYQFGHVKNQIIEWIDTPKVNSIDKIFIDKSYNNLTIVSPNLNIIKEKIIKAFPEKEFSYLNNSQNISYLNEICYSKLDKNHFEKIKLMYLK